MPYIDAIKSKLPAAKGSGATIGFEAKFIAGEGDCVWGSAETRDEYKPENVFWALAAARCSRPRSMPISLGSCISSITLRPRAWPVLSSLMGTLVNRVHRELTDDDIEKIVSTYHSWRDDNDAWRAAMEKEGATLPEFSVLSEDIPGFCKSASTAEIAAHGYVLTPGRYVGTEEVADDGEPFEERCRASSPNCTPSSPSPPGSRKQFAPT